MKRHLLIFVILILSVSIFLLISRKKPNPILPVSHSSSEDNIPVSKTITKTNRITPNSVIQPSLSESYDSDLDPDRDFLLWRSVSEEVEKAWDKEIYSHIQYIDREHADELYKAYLIERKSYLMPQQTTLVDTMDNLSRLNGESIYNEKEHLRDEDHHEEFTTKLRSVFRENYGFIETQRKIFIDAQTL